MFLRCFEGFRISDGLRFVFFLLYDLCAGLRVLPVFGLFEFCTLADFVWFAHVQYSCHRPVVEISFSDAHAADADARSKTTVSTGVVIAPAQHKMGREENDSENINIYPALPTPPPLAPSPPPNPSSRLLLSLVRLRLLHLCGVVWCGVVWCCIIGLICLCRLLIGQ